MHACRLCAFLCALWVSAAQESSASPIPGAPLSCRAATFRRYSCLVCRHVPSRRLQGR